MAFYKMNVLHLHLTDDQGWRLEIRSHPELTARGARFPDHWNEPPAHHGHYTQAEMRELIRYAADRQITIVPEIETPGHALAALAVYPAPLLHRRPVRDPPVLRGGRTSTRTSSVPGTTTPSASWRTCSTRSSLSSPRR